MAHDISIKEKAKELRQAGYSIKEISKVLNISQSTSSIWVRNIKVSSVGKSRMIERQELKRYKMSQAWKRKTEEQNAKFNHQANTLISNVIINESISKIICSTLFWAEGSKNINHIGFTNSDPLMIVTFLSLLRQSFRLDESKFHVSVHLHEYHEKNTTVRYWSDLTSIPLDQFIKPYLKPHTAKRKKPEYMGCITIRYYDYKIARELTAIYNALGCKYRDVVQR